MAKLLNRAKMTVSGTPWDGDITLNTAVSGFASFAEAGAEDATVYTYVAEDGNDFEIGHGTYTESGTTFSRDTVLLSKISGTAGTTKLTLTSAATVAITIAAEDFDFATTTQGAKADSALQSDDVATQSDMETATSLTAPVVPGRQHFHPSAAKAALSVSTSLSSIGGNVSSENTSTDVITWSTSHSLSTGDLIYIASGTWTTGVQVGAVYYVNVPSSNTFTLHTSVAAALAGTGKVDLTGTGSGTRTASKVTVTTNFSFNCTPQFLCGFTVVRPNLLYANNISANAIVFGGAWSGSFVNYNVMPTNLSNTNRGEMQLTNAAGTAQNWSDIASITMNFGMVVFGVMS